MKKLFLSGVAILAVAIGAALSGEASAEEREHRLGAVQNWRQDAIHEWRNSGQSLAVEGLRTPNRGAQGVHDWPDDRNYGGYNSPHE